MNEKPEEGGGLSPLSSGDDQTPEVGLDLATEHGPPLLLMILHRFYTQATLNKAHYRGGCRKMKGGGLDLASLGLIYAPGKKI